MKFIFGLMPLRTGIIVRRRSGYFLNPRPDTTRIMIDTPTLNEMKYGTRKSQMSLNEIYFWTDTIKDWRKLLEEDPFKEIIIECWRKLVKRKKIAIYGFVIMPNHLHIIWEMLEKNGKEMPHAGFNKFTSHQFLENLRLKSVEVIDQYKEEDSPVRMHRFWQRDPLAVMM